jgi:hypothetical protein
MGKNFWQVLSVMWFVYTVSNFQLREDYFPLTPALFPMGGKVKDKSNLRLCHHKKNPAPPTLSLRFGEREAICNMRIYMNFGTNCAALPWATLTGLSLILPFLCQ